MGEKMPYLKEDEIIINSKTATTATSNSSASDVDDAEESLFENKVGATVNEHDELRSWWREEECDDEKKRRNKPRGKRNTKERTNKRAVRSYNAM